MQHKNSDKVECANDRAITLLNVKYKVFSTILYSRHLPQVESKLGHYQAVFRPRKWKKNHILRMRQILENNKEFKNSIYRLLMIPKCISQD